MGLKDGKAFVDTCAYVVIVVKSSVKTDHRVVTAIVAPQIGTKTTERTIRIKSSLWSNNQLLIRGWWLVPPMKLRRRLGKVKAASLGMVMG